MGELLREPLDVLSFLFLLFFSHLHTLLELLLQLFVLQAHFLCSCHPLLNHLSQLLSQAVFFLLQLLLQPFFSNQHLFFVFFFHFLLFIVELLFQK